MNPNPVWLLNKMEEQFPEKVAIIYKNETLDFMTLNRRANRLAHVLYTIGMKTGNRIGILFPNCPEFVVAYLAVQKAGGVAVPLDVRLVPEEISRVLYAVQASCLITLPSIKPPELGSRPIITIEKELIWIQGKLLGPPDSSLGIDRAPDDEATYLLTSGSTGRPKLAILTLENLRCFPRAMRELFNTTPSDVYGMLLPMSHVSGPVVIQELIEHGTTLVLFGRLDGRNILQTIQEHKVSLMWGVAPIYRLLIQAAKRGEFDTRNLRLLAVMGMETPLSFLEELSQAFPNTAVVQGYGLTETSGPIIGVSPSDAARKLGSVGRPASFMEVRVVDSEGKPLSPGEYGEIIVKGPAVMKGYYRDKRATKDRIKGGWLYTGDIGRFDEEGYFYLSGRKDDMIITGGLNVFPGEVEEVIGKHPQVKEVAVVGIPDPRRGEIIEAVIVPRSNNISKKEILAFCKNRLADYKCPRSIRFVTELPRTTTGKISRNALRFEKGSPNG